MDRIKHSIPIKRKNKLIGSYFKIFLQVHLFTSFHFCSLITLIATKDLRWFPDTCLHLPSTNLTSKYSFLWCDALWFMSSSSAEFRKYNMPKSDGNWGSSLVSNTASQPKHRFLHFNKHLR